MRALTDLSADHATGNVVRSELVQGGRKGGGGGSNGYPGLLFFLSVLIRVFSSSFSHEPVGVYQQIDTRPSLKGGVTCYEHDLKFAKIILNANLENSPGT